MVAGVGLEPHDLLVMSPVVVPPRPQSRRATTKSLLFQNSPMGVAPAKPHILWEPSRVPYIIMGNPLRVPLFFTLRAAGSVLKSPLRIFLIFLIFLIFTVDEFIVG